MHIKDGAPGALDPSFRLMAQKSGRKEFILSGKTSRVKQPNDSFPNLFLQSNMRRWIGRRALRIARENHAKGLSRAIPNHTISELCEGLYHSCKAIKTKHITSAFALTGYSEDETKFSSELKYSYILANPPELSKLPELERERMYDPTGLVSQPRKATKDLKHPRVKRFQCTFRKWEAGFYYAKFHDETRGGTCPSKEVEKNFKPIHHRYACFFSKNFQPIHSIFNYALLMFSFQMKLTI